MESAAITPFPPVATLPGPPWAQSQCRRIPGLAKIALSKCFASSNRKANPINSPRLQRSQNSRTLRQGKPPKSFGHRKPQEEHHDRRQRRYAHRNPETIGIIFELLERRSGQRKNKPHRNHPSRQSAIIFHHRSSFLDLTARRVRRGLPHRQTRCGKNVCFMANSMYIHLLRW